MNRIAWLVPMIALIGAGQRSTIGMQFEGHWEVVKGYHDGRLAGASARSFHIGDALKINVRGAGFRIYGVTGPTGGHAVVIVPHHPDRTIDFYSPTKRTHVPLYQSPNFGAGDHVAGLVIVPERDPRSRGNYVNIDAVEVL